MNFKDKVASASSNSDIVDLIGMKPTEEEYKILIKKAEEITKKQEEELKKLKIKKSQKPLTDPQIKNVELKDKAYQLNDGAGLSLYITPKGQKWWRYRYTFDGKAKLISLGTYPATSLAKARKKLYEARVKVADGIDPSAERKAEKEMKREEKAKKENTFKVVAEKYLQHKQNTPKKGRLPNDAYMKRLFRAFERDVYPSIGKIAITEVTEDQIEDIIEDIKNRGAIETASRIFAQISAVFTYGIKHKDTAKRRYCTSNPCILLEIEFEYETKSYPIIEKPKEIGHLLNSIEDYSGEYLIKMALLFASNVAVRPANIRFAQWDEIDFDNHLWKIPASKMKTNKDHLVPLSSQSTKMLKEVEKLTVDANYIFHSPRSKTSPMSDAAMLNALRRLGYSKDEIVVHSFRAMFSTISNEREFAREEVIEVQLAHSVGSKSAKAYNRAKYLNERRELMQKWSDFIEEVRR